jgi:hypothetical protein
VGTREEPARRTVGGAGQWAEERRGACACGTAAESEPFALALPAAGARGWFDRARPYIEIIRAEDFHPAGKGI